MLGTTRRLLRPTSRCFTGSPRLHGVLAALECTVENRLPGGDHEIVIGRVQDVEISDDSAAPLLYWRGSYLPLGGSQRSVTLLPII